MARLINKAYSLALLLFCYVLSGAAEAAYNVADFGAKPDGRTDSTGAFASAWSAACRRSQAPATVYFFLLSRAAFFTGPMLQQDDASGHPDQHPDRGRRLRLRRRPRHHQPAARGARQLRISSPRPVIVTVDQAGRGHYRTIQEAINAIPARANNSTSATIARINVNPGIYTEKVVVNKPGVSLIGRSATSTIIQWSGPWDKKHQSEFALHVLATDFVAANLTFQNPYGREGKGPAVAAKIEGDKAAFYDCRFISFQDTLLDATGRHYYRGCYIQGATDFIFGTGKAFFERCHLHSTSHVGGAFTAQRRCTESENTGFSFYRCELTGTGVATAILGRPWGPYARVVFAQCDMSNAVAPMGWSNWEDEANNNFSATARDPEHKAGSSGRTTTSLERKLSPSSPMLGWMAKIGFVRRSRNLLWHSRHI
ncbi:hypothetical protein SORBI_3008G135901 [Sorghum bicolor]|uniref:Pectinesterase n=1 Tax=Sorghum bicolor TaxID=4558 RepID=A0A1Z5R6I9_SORBI|nr:hypothetical protein SORBI_3008G135901 [Sorghum bicolor]